MDRVTLYEEYRLIEKNDSEVNVAWKGAHLLLFFLSFVFGSFCTFCFHVLIYLFDEKCVLYPKLLSLKDLRRTGTAGGIILEYISTKDVDSLPVDFVTTQWMDASTCYLPTYVPLLSGICGLVWTTMFLMCSSGSRTLSGLQRPWRILPAVFVFSLAMGGLCVYTSVITHNGLQELCSKLGEATGSSSCIYTINVATLLYERRIRGVYQATRLTMLSAWLHTCCWLGAALLALVRVILVVDFRLVRVRADLLGNIEKMLERQEQHIRTDEFWNKDDYTTTRDETRSSSPSVKTNYKNQYFDSDSGQSTRKQSLGNIDEQMAMLPQDQNKLIALSAEEKSKKGELTNIVGNAEITEPLEGSSRNFKNEEETQELYRRAGIKHQNNVTSVQLNESSESNEKILPETQLDLEEKARLRQADSKKQLVKITASFPSMTSQETLIPSNVTTNVSLKDYFKMGRSGEGMLNITGSNFLSGKSSSDTLRLASLSDEIQSSQDDKTPQKLKSKSVTILEPGSADKEKPEEQRPRNKKEQKPEIQVEQRSGTSIKHGPYIVIKKQKSLPVAKKRPGTVNKKGWSFSHHSSLKTEKIKQPAAEEEQAPEDVRKLRPSTSKEYRFESANTQRSEAVKEQGLKSIKEQEPSFIKEQRPGSAEELEPITIKKQILRIIGELVPGIVQKQRLATVEQQGPGTIEEQRTTSVWEQIPATIDEQGPSSIREQIPGTIDEQRPSSIKEQRPVTIEEQQPSSEPGRGTKERQGPSFIKKQKVVSIEERGPLSINEQGSGTIEEQVLSSIQGSRTIEEHDSKKLTPKPSKIIKPDPNKKEKQD